MNANARWRLMQVLLRTGDARLRKALWDLLREGRWQQRVGALATELARSLPQLQDSEQVRELKLLRRLLLDERVPLWQKAIPVAAALYLVAPLDLIPDFLPLVGQLDDLAVLLGSLRLFRSLVPPALIEEHLAYIDGELVDAPGWRSSSSPGTSSGTGTGTFAGSGTGGGSLDAP
ncbi:MAG: YkvA family protein [Anaerolineaceae bacterium]|nr:YkvA family protein [Anaerolineaceae bacterium]MCY4022520.1 YkvA family protein [Anaerolineaceae bacterium]